MAMKTQSHMQFSFASITRMAYEAIVYVGYVVVACVRVSMHCLVVESHARVRHAL